MKNLVMYFAIMTVVLGLLFKGDSVGDISSYRFDNLISATKYDWIIEKNQDNSLAVSYDPIRGITPAVNFDAFHHTMEKLH